MITFLSKRFLFAASSLALIAGLVSCGSDNQTTPLPSEPRQDQVAPASPVVVNIPMNADTLGAEAYGTNPLVIPAGTMVTWMNNDTVPHTATDAGVFDTGSIAPGASSSPISFSTVGTFDYTSTVDTAGSMTGAIEVTPSPSPSSSASPSPSVTPSASPTPSPSASMSPSPTPTPTETMGPTPKKGCWGWGNDCW